MLASVPVVWLWLVAAAASVLFCVALGTWIPDRKLQVSLPVILAGCGVGMVLVATRRGLEPNEILITYSSALISATIGMFPMRNMLKQAVRGAKAGTSQEPVHIPKRYINFCVACVFVTSLVTGLLMFAR